MTKEILERANGLHAKINYRTEDVKKLSDIENPYELIRYYDDPLFPKEDFNIVKQKYIQRVIEELEKAKKELASL